MNKSPFIIKCAIQALLCLLILNFKLIAQTCPTTTVCFPPNSGNGAGTYVVIPTPINLANAVIIPDADTLNFTGPRVFATKAACITNGSVNDTLDVLLTVCKPDSATNSTPTFGSPSQTTFTLSTSGIVQFKGTGNQTYLFKTYFFKTGTNTPLPINVLQQITDIDGDGDWNNDGNRDDGRCNVPLPTNDIGPSGQTLDDYVYATGFTNYVLASPTLVYPRPVGALTYFHASGKNNAPAYSGISSIPATPTVFPASAQAVILVYVNASQLDFSYYAGQYGGISIDYTAQNLLIPLPCTTTPIKLNYFTASKQNSFNRLNWQSSNEINSNHFDIERSYDGLIFKKIAAVTTVNNSNGSTYSYTDSITTQYTIAYYRLKMVDNNGSYSYSNISVLKSTDHYKLISIYPNSTSDIFSIKVSNQSLVNTKAIFYDVNGRRIKTLTLTGQLQEVNISSFTNGIYLLHFNNGDTFKIIKK